MFYQGILQKMRTQASTPVHYELAMSGLTLTLNDYLGKAIYLQHTGKIFCLNCGQKTAKSFSQGYCFKCFRSSASADMCIMKPETCHYHLGTCREPDWAQSHCFRPHIVYLANSSGVKVGITRKTQIPTRWLDQGARQALPIFEVQSRLLSGLIEVVLAQHIADKTNWQRLLKSDAEYQDLTAIRDELMVVCAKELADLAARFPQQMQALTQNMVDFHFPVQQYPVKVKSFNFDTTPQVKGVLQGIKGQYLILDTGVINLRKFGGYEIMFGEESDKS
jgi:hypothetical protein